MTPIAVEVVIAMPEVQQVRRVELHGNATVLQAIEASGLLATLTPDLRVGVFGRLCALSDRVADGDRVEIYRALLADPKTARRQRAAKKIRAAARQG